MSRVRGPVALALALGFARGAAAQSPADLLVSARHQLESLFVDSAAALLRQVTVPGSHASDAERATAAVLSGAEQLIRGNDALARAAFRAALAIDPTLRVDSLARLHSRLSAVFEAVRAEAVAVALILPRDTVLPPDSALHIGVRTSAAAPVIVTLTSAAGTVLLTDTQTVAGTGWFHWMPDPVDRPLALRVVAAGASGDSTAVTRSMTVTRQTVDTDPLPPPLAAGQLLPESTTAATRLRPRALLVGLAYGVGAAALATAGAEPVQGSDGRAFLVGAALSAAGVVGFLKGGHVTHAIPDNVEHNRQLRGADADRRAAVIRANAERRAGAGTRVVVTGGT